MNSHDIDYPGGFIRRLYDFSEIEMNELMEQAQQKSMAIGFATFREDLSACDVLNNLALDLKLPNAPYGVRHLVQFLDNINTVVGAYSDEKDGLDGKKDFLNGIIMVAENINYMRTADTEFILTFLEFCALSASRWQKIGKKLILFIKL